MVDCLIPRIADWLVDLSLHKVALALKDYELEERRS